MAVLIQAWLEADILTQLIVIILVTVGIVKGIIVIPWIKIGNKPNLVEKTLKIWLIKTKQTLYEQMNIVEVTHSAVLFKMTEIYRCLNPSPNDLQHYELLIAKIESKCKSFIRKWLKENHYSERSDENFELYIDEKVTFLLELIIKELNTFYRDDMFSSVSRETLREENTLHLIDYSKSKWHKMFIDCRRITVSNEKKVKKLEECKGI